MTVNMTGCEFDSHSRCGGIGAALRSAIPHAMPTEFVRKWEAQCLNTTLPLPTLLYAGYSMKMKEELNVKGTLPKYNIYF